MLQLLLSGPPRGQLPVDDALLPRQSSGSRLVVPRSQRLVWRPRSVAPGHGAPPVTLAARGEVPEGSQGRKRRRRTRRKGHSGPRRSADDDRQDSREDGGGCPNPRVSSGDDGAAMDSGYSRPRRILDRSSSISRREDDLARALVVTLLNGCADSILSSIASRFEVDVSRCPYSVSGMRGSS